MEGGSISLVGLDSGDGSIEFGRNYKSFIWIKRSGVTNITILLLYV